MTPVRPQPPSHAYRRSSIRSDAHAVTPISSSSSAPLPHVPGGLLTAIEDQYQKITEVDGIKVSVELLDTAGTEQFMALHSMYMKSGDGFILVFSLTSMDSLQELSSLRDQILRLKEVDGYHAVSRPVLVCLLYTTKLTSVSVG